jgi:hypothetical protein
VPSKESPGEIWNPGAVEIAIPPTSSTAPAGIDLHAPYPNFEFVATNECAHEFVATACFSSASS